jgi:diacylglycerol kinase (ATP)
MYNRKSGRADPAIEAAVVRGLERMGHAVELFVPQAKGQMTQLARDACTSGYELLVSVGGDGTLNEVVNGALGTSVPVGVIPLGTVNVFARCTNVPLTVDAALDLIAKGAPRPVTLGRANQRAFVFTAGIGLDSEVLSNEDLKLKKYIGRYSYYVKTFTMLPTWRPPRLEISFDGEVPVPAEAVIFGKTRLYGDRFLMTPHASPFDDQVDACIFRQFDPLRFMRVAVASTRDGAHLTDSCIGYRKFSRATITSPDQAHIHVDGEYMGTLPVEINAMPQALQVWLPRC